MPSLPNLHLKLNVFREILSLTFPNTQIAHQVFGGKNDETPERSIKFTRMIYGDLACTREYADALVNKVLNDRIRTFRAGQGLSPQGDVVLTALDLELPLYDFTRRLLAAVNEKVPAEALQRAHRSILEQLAPLADSDAALRLNIERRSRERMFETMRPSGGKGPQEFKAGRDEGRFTLEGLRRDPVAAYVLITRDPAPLKRHLWDLSWGETVLWLPSPFVPKREGDAHVLMDRSPVKAVPGRFLVTAALVLDGQVLPKLDPRGAKVGLDTPDLDEEGTSLFLTRLRRLVKDKADTIAVATNEYVVVA